MAAGIINAVCTFVSQNAYGGIGCTVWDGEVHRYDPQGQTVGPESSGGRMSWPIIKFSMPDSGFNRNWTFEDPYHDIGLIYCQIFATTRAEAEAVLDMIDEMFASLANWDAIGLLIPSPYVENLHYVVSLLLQSWLSKQVEGARTEKSELIYTCEAYFKCTIHGAVPTA